MGRLEPASSHSVTAGSCPRVTVSAPGLLVDRARDGHEAFGMAGVVLATGERANGLGAEQLGRGARWPGVWCLAVCATGIGPARVQDCGSLPSRLRCRSMRTAIAVCASMLVTGGF